MSFCFQSFNYSPSISYCINRNSKEKKKHARAKLPPSIVPQAEEINGPAPFSNKPSTDKKFGILLNDQANGIGIIGGLSVDSSLTFTNKLVNLNKLEGEDSGPPFVLCSDPGIKTELSSLRGKVEQGHTDDQSSVVENLRRKRVFLEGCGVSCIVMPCHVSHSWHDEIKEGCCVEFLHMGECVAKELKEANLRPIEAGSCLRIGVLSYNGVVGRVYREKLENEGFEVIMPDKATMEHTVIPAVEALSRKDFEGAQNLFRIALQVLLVRAVNKIILASDELREILPPNDPLWRKCVDPMDALARSTVKFARSAERGEANSR